MNVDGVVRTVSGAQAGQGDPAVEPAKAQRNPFAAAPMNYSPIGQSTILTFDHRRRQKGDNVRAKFPEDAGPFRTLR
jgi:hypothetical protein